MEIPLDPRDPWEFSVYTHLYYKLSKLDQTDLGFGFWSEFIGRSRLQVTTVIRICNV